MPTSETIESFQKGLQMLASAEDYLSLKNTILHLLSITEQQDEIMAKDAIASVLRKKQAADIQKYKHYPREMEAVDQKYKDLAVALEASRATQPNTAIKTLSDNSLGNPLGMLSKLGGSAMLDFLSKNKALSLGSAAALAGGSYLVYKRFFDSKKEKITTEKESNFERTIKSIQKYRAFSQLSKDPDFDGNYLEIFQGKAPKKKKPVSKRESENVSTKWEREEKSLMQNMDIGFNEIAIRPRIDFKMPQLPAPKNIDPSEVLGGSSNSEPPFETSRTETSKVSKSKKKASKTVNREEKKDPLPAQSAGRLIPIVKRTKRIKKIEV